MKFMLSAGLLLFLLSGIGFKLLQINILVVLGYVCFLLVLILILVLNREVLGRYSIFIQYC